MMDELLHLFAPAVLAIHATMAKQLKTRYNKVKVSHFSEIPATGSKKTVQREIFFRFIYSLLTY